MSRVTPSAIARRVPGRRRSHPTRYLGKPGTERPDGRGFCANRAVCMAPAANAKVKTAFRARVVSLLLDTSRSQVGDTS
jgi:hypothetical protein